MKRRKEQLNNSQQPAAGSYWMSGSPLMLCVSRILSWVLIASFMFTFIINDYAYATLDVKIKDLIEIPFEYGQVVERYDPGTKSPKVILIQDLHANYEVQKNISAIIDHLNRVYKVDKIGLEGTPVDTKIDVSLVTSIPDRERRKESVDFFMKNGMIKGAEGYVALTRNPPPIVGIENKKLYETDRNLLLMSLGHRDQVVEYLQRIKYLLRTVEDRVFSSNVKKFRSHFILYKQGKLSPYAFQKYLKEWSGFAGMNIQSISTEYSKYMNLTERRHRINSEKIEKEYNRLLKTMKLLKYEQDTDLTGTARIVRNFSNTPESIREKMYRRIESEKCYSNLCKYMANVKLSQEINTQKLVTEEDKVIKSICRGLCENEKEKDLIYVIDYVQLLIKFLLNQISRQELDDFYAEAEIFEKKFNSLIPSHQNEIAAIDGVLFALKPFVEEMGNFYNIATKRDEEFVKNFVDNASRKEKTLVMVSGGFHTAGIAKKLKEKRIHHTVIVPRVTSHSEDITKMYYALLRGDQPFTYEDLLLETLALMSYFGQTWFLKRVVVRTMANKLREGLKEEGFTSNFRETIRDFFREWTLGYMQFRDKDKARTPFNFYLENAISRSDTIYFHIKINSEKLMFGVKKDGKLVFAKQPAADMIVEEWSLEKEDERLGKIKDTSLDYRKVDDKKIIATAIGTDPLSEMPNNRIDAVSSLIKNSEGNLGIIRIGKRSFLYDRKAVLLRIAEESNRFKEAWNKFDEKYIHKGGKKEPLIRFLIDQIQTKKPKDKEKLEAFLAAILKRDDDKDEKDKNKNWELVKILEGYPVSAVIDTKDNIVFTMTKNIKDRIIKKDEAQKLPDVTNQEAYARIVKKLSGDYLKKLAKKPKIKETQPKLSVKAKISAALTDYKYHIAIGIIGVAAIATAVVTAPIWAGSVAIVGTIALLYIWQQDRQLPGIRRNVPSRTTDEETIEEVPEKDDIDLAAWQMFYTEKEINSILNTFIKLDDGTHMQSILNSLITAVNKAIEANNIESVLYAIGNLSSHINSDTVSSEAKTVFLKFEEKVRKIVQDKFNGEIYIPRTGIVFNNGPHAAAEMTREASNAAREDRIIASVVTPGFMSSDRSERIKPKIEVISRNEYNAAVSPGKGTSAEELERVVINALPKSARESARKAVRDVLRTNRITTLNELTGLLIKIKGIGKPAIGRITRAINKSGIFETEDVVVEPEELPTLSDLEMAYVIAELGDLESRIYAVRKVSTIEDSIKKMQEIIDTVPVWQRSEQYDGVGHYYGEAKISLERPISAIEEAKEKIERLIAEEKARMEQAERVAKRTEKVEAKIARKAQKTEVLSLDLESDIMPLLPDNLKPVAKAGIVSRILTLEKELTENRVNDLLDNIKKLPGLDYSQIREVIAVLKAKGVYELVQKKEEAARAEKIASLNLEDVINDRLTDLGQITRAAVISRIMRAGELTEEKLEDLLKGIGGIPGVSQDDIEKIKQALREKGIYEVAQKEPVEVAAKEQDKAFFKSVNDWTKPRRFGRVYERIEDEYNALKRIYEIAPENTVKPLNLEYDENGNVTGYWMENMNKADYIDLYKYIEEGNQLNSGFFKKLAQLIAYLHSKGVVHGDIGASNILINKNNNNLFKLIDPIGYPIQGTSDYMDFKDSVYHRAVKNDLEMLKKLSIKIEASKVKVAKAPAKKPAGPRSGQEGFLTRDGMMWAIGSGAVVGTIALVIATAVFSLTGGIAALVSGGAALLAVAGVTVGLQYIERRRLPGRVLTGESVTSSPRSRIIKAAAAIGVFTTILTACGEFRNDNLIRDQIEISQSDLIASISYTEFLELKNNPEMSHLLPSTYDEFNRLQNSRAFTQNISKVIGLMNELDPDRAAELLDQIKDENGKIRFIVLDIPYHAMAKTELGLIIIGKSHLEKIQDSSDLLAELAVVIAHEANHVLNYNAGLCGDEYRYDLVAAAKEEERAYIEALRWMKLLEDRGYYSGEAVVFQEFITDHIKDNNYMGVIAMMVTADSRLPEDIVNKISALNNASENLADNLGVSVEELQYGTVLDFDVETHTPGEPLILLQHFVQTEFTLDGVLYKAVIDYTGEIVNDPEQISVSDHMERVMDEDYSLETRQIFVASLIELATTETDAQDALDSLERDITERISEIESTEYEDGDVLIGEYNTLLDMISKGFAEIDQGGFFMTDGMMWALGSGAVVGTIALIVATAVFSLTGGIAGLIGIGAFIMTAGIVTGIQQYIEAFVKQGEEERYLTQVRLYGYLPQIRKILEDVAEEEEAKREKFTGKKGIKEDSVYFVLGGVVEIVYGDGDTIELSAGDFISKLSLEMALSEVHVRKAILRAKGGEMAEMLTVPVNIFTEILKKNPEVIGLLKSVKDIDDLREVFEKMRKLSEEAREKEITPGVNKDVLKMLQVDEELVNSLIGMLTPEQVSGFQQQLEAILETIQRSGSLPYLNSLLDEIIKSAITNPSISSELLNILQKLNNLLVTEKNSIKGNTGFSLIADAFIDYYGIKNGALVRNTKLMTSHGDNVPPISQIVKIIEVLEKATGIPDGGKSTVGSVLTKLAEKKKNIPSIKSLSASLQELQNIIEKHSIILPKGLLEKIIIKEMKLPPTVKEGTKVLLNRLEDLSDILDGINMTPKEKSHLVLGILVMDRERPEGDREIDKYLENYEEEKGKTLFLVEDFNPVYDKETYDVELFDHHGIKAVYGDTATKQVTRARLNEILNRFTDPSAEFENIVIIKNHHDADSLLAEMKLRGIFNAELETIINDASVYADYLTDDGIEDAKHARGVALMMDVREQKQKKRVVQVSAASLPYKDLINIVNAPEKSSVDKLTLDKIYEEINRQTKKLLSEERVDIRDEIAVVRLDKDIKFTESINEAVKSLDKEEKVKVTVIQRPVEGNMYGYTIAVQPDRVSARPVSNIVRALNKHEEKENWGERLYLASIGRSKLSLNEVYKIVNDNMGKKQIDLAETGKKISRKQISKLLAENGISAEYVSRIINKYPNLNEIENRVNPILELIKSIKKATAITGKDKANMLVTALMVDTEVQSEVYNKDISEIIKLNSNKVIIALDFEPHGIPKNRTVLNEEDLKKSIAQGKLPNPGNIVVFDHHSEKYTKNDTATTLVDSKLIRRLIKAGREVVIVRNHHDSDSIYSEVKLRGYLPGKLTELTERASIYGDYTTGNGEARRMVLILNEIIAGKATEKAAKKITDTEYKAYMANNIAMVAVEVAVEPKEYADIFKAAEKKIEKEKKLVNKIVGSKYYEYGRGGPPILILSGLNGEPLENRLKQEVLYKYIPAKYKKVKIIISVLGRDKGQYKYSVALADENRAGDTNNLKILEAMLNQEEPEGNPWDGRQFVIGPSWRTKSSLIPDRVAEIAQEYLYKLNRVEGESKLLDIFEKQGFKGFIGMADMDKLGEMNKYYGRDLVDFLIDYYMDILHKMSIKYGGFAIRWGGDEAMTYLPPTVKKPAEIFEEMRRQVEGNIRGKYGVAKIGINKLDINRVEKLKKNSDITALGEFGDSYYMFFKVKNKDVENSLKLFNEKNKVNFELDEYNDGWLFRPTISMGALDISKIPEAKRQKDPEKFLEIVREYLGRAEEKAKETRNTMVYGVFPAKKGEEGVSVLSEDQKKDIMSFDNIPEENGLRETVDEWLGDEEKVTLVKLLPSYNSRGLEADLRSSKGRNWWRFKAVNTKYGLIGGDEVIGRIFYEVKEQFEGWDGDVVYARGPPDEIVLAFKGKVNKEEFFKKVNNIRDAVNMGNIINVGFDALAIESEAERETTGELAEGFAYYSIRDFRKEPVFKEKTRLMRRKSDYEAIISKAYSTPKYNNPALVKKWNNKIPQNFSELITLFKETDNKAALLKLMALIDEDYNGFKLYVSMINKVFSRMNYLSLLQGKMDIASMFSTEWDAAMLVMGEITDGEILLKKEQKISDLYVRTLDDPLFGVLLTEDSKLREMTNNSKMVALSDGEGLLLREDNLKRATYGKEIMALKDGINNGDVIRSYGEEPFYSVMTRKEYRLLTAAIKNNVGRGLPVNKEGKAILKSGFIDREDVNIEPGKILVKITGDAVPYTTAVEEDQALIFYIRSASRVVRTGDMFRKLDELETVIAPADNENIVKPEISKEGNIRLFEYTPDKHAEINARFKSFEDLGRPGAFSVLSSIRRLSTIQRLTAMLRNLAGNVMDALVNTLGSTSAVEVNMLAGELGIDRIVPGRMNSFENNTLVLAYDIYDSIIDVYDRSKDKDMAFKLLKISLESTVSYKEYKNDVDKYYDNLMRGLDPYIAEVDAIALPYWFRHVFRQGADELVGSKLDDYIRGAMGISAGQKILSKDLDVINRMAEINLEFHGEKQIDEAPSSYGMMAAADKKDIVKQLRSGVRQLVRAVARLGKVVVSMPLSMTITLAELPLMKDRRWDSLQSAIFLGEGRLSILEVIDQQMRALTGRKIKPDESIAPNLNKLKGIHSAT